jgi:hypothetical protein
MSKLEAPTLEQLVAEWERDAAVDVTDAGKEMIRIPLLHSKYNKYLTLHNLATKRKENEFAKQRKLKWMYYNGKLDQQELASLGLEPFPFTLKADLNIYMDADTDLIAIHDRQTLHEECSAFCVYVMKELNNRTWQMKSWMDWTKFEAGGGH